MKRFPKTGIGEEMASLASLFDEKRTTALFWSVWICVFIIQSVSRSFNFFFFQRTNLDALDVAKSLKVVADLTDVVGLGRDVFDIERAIVEV